MKNAQIRSVLYATAAALILTGCGADDVASPGEGTIILPSPTPTPTPTATPTPTPTPTSTPAASCPTGTVDAGILTKGDNVQVRTCQISGTITGSLAIPNQPGTVYQLSGRVSVGTDVGADGAAAGGASATLTIDPGVVMFGASGADFLLVNRGSRIFAQGTATQPIIMTSRANVLGTSTSTSKGQWGGLVVLGRAPISNCATGGIDNPGGTRTDCQQTVEGTSGAAYGGNVAADNSGVLSFLQVRYSGFEVTAGNELNGITLAGVGSGTTFNNVQVHNSSDDGIEWFGGRVNGKNIALTGNDDDSIDTDFGYQGNNQYVLVLQGASANHVWEADSNGGEDARPRSRVRLSNATLISTQSAANESALLMRGGHDFEIFNTVITGPGTCIDIDSQTTIQAANAALDENGPPSFRSTFLSCPTAFSANTGSGTSAVTAAEIEAIFAAATASNNNTANGTSTLASVFINGVNETAVATTAVASVSSFFENATYIGAVKDANDTRFRGWTCGIYAADAACTAVPATR